MKNRFFVSLIVLALAGLACSLVSSSATPAPENSNVLFQDDFSNPDSGWDRVNVADGTTDYVDGVYQIYVNTSNTDVWANPGLSFNDTHVEVDATKVGGDDNNDFGLICRYQDSQNFYFFIISSDGYYGIGKVQDGNQDLLGNDSMPPSDAIHTGDASNHLRADCVGSTLTMYVNGQQLGSVDDTTFASGDVGLLAGSFDTAGTNIQFDNFVVLQP